MKKGLALLLCAALSIGIFSCGKGKEEKAPERTYELAMITISESRSIDDGDCVQSAWEGLKAFAEEEEITYKYYEPVKDTDTARRKQIDRAAGAGASVIVCAGTPFEKVVGEAQQDYPELTFILAGAVPKDENGETNIGSNCVSIGFRESEAGFLAGFAAVSEGFRHLGFMGESRQDSIKNYGYGFLQGCSAAAEARGTYVSVHYRYGQQTDSAAVVQKYAENWFGEGTEVIFACGDTVVDSAAVEADIAGGRVIASAPPKRAVQNILAYVEPVYTDSVREQLAAVYTDGFEGGRILTPGASDDAWQLCMKEDQFSYFRQEDCEAVYRQLQDGQLKPASADKAKSAAGLVKELELWNIELIL